MSRQYVSVQDNLIEYAQQMLAHLPGEAEKAAARAINRSVQNARGNIVKSVRENYTAKAGDVRATIRVTKADKNRLHSIISSRGPVLSLMSFKVSPGTVNGKRRTPLRASVKKGSRESLGTAFVARVNRGQPVGVFRRKGKERFPVNKLFGPSVPQMINNERVVDKIYTEARRTMESRIEHEIGRILQRKAK